MTDKQKIGLVGILMWVSLAIALAVPFAVPPLVLTGAQRLAVLAPVVTISCGFWIWGVTFGRRMK